MRIAALIPLVAVLGCGSKPPNEVVASKGEDTPAKSIPLLRHDLGIDFAAWPSVTVKPIPVASYILSLCRSATSEEAEKLRGDEAKHGPHHASAIVVRVNPTGMTRFKSGESLPVGAIIAKEKHQGRSADGPPSAVAFMIKREKGYNPAHGDWEYVYQDGLHQEVRAPVERGRIATCIECHERASKSDYVFRTYLPKSNVLNGKP